MSGIKYSLCCWLILYVEGVASSCANCLALKAEIFCTEIYKYSFIKIREIFARDFLLLLYLFPWNLMRFFEIVEILRCLVKTSVCMYSLSFFEIIALIAGNYLFNEIFSLRCYALRTIFHVTMQLCNNSLKKLSEFKNSRSRYLRWQEEYPLLFVDVTAGREARYCEYSLVEKVHVWSRMETAINRVA